MQSYSHIECQSSLEQENLVFSRKSSEEPFETRTPESSTLLNISADSQFVSPPTHVFDDDYDMSSNIGFQGNYNESDLPSKIPAQSAKSNGLTQQSSVSTVAIPSSASPNCDSQLSQLSFSEKVLYIKFESDISQDMKESEYYITPRGAFQNPDRLTLDGYISQEVIGQHCFSIGKMCNKTRPPLTHIEIPASSGYLSRDHAHINWKGAYSGHAQWKASFMCFLWCQKQGNRRSLSAEINKHIFEFIREPYHFYLEHKGLSSNTYQKISHHVPMRLESDRTISLASDIDLDILEIQHTFHPAKLQPNQIDFAQDLMSLMRTHHVKVIGIQNSSLAHLKRASKKATSSSTVNWESQLRFGVPYLKLEIGSANSQAKQKYLVFPQAKDKFVIGRENDADMKIRSPNCSRRQARICWQREKEGDGFQWVILDGEEGRSSLNGTWMNLRTISEVKYGMSSKLMPIEHGAVFKFGETNATMFIGEVLFTKEDLLKFRNYSDGKAPTHVEKKDLRKSQLSQERSEKIEGFPLKTTKVAVKSD